MFHSFSVFIIPYIAPFFLMLLGVFTHFITELKSLRDEGKMLGPLEYWTKYPYRSLLTLIWGFVGFLLLKDVSHLTSLNAFLYGYMADSLPKTFANRVGSDMLAQVKKVDPLGKN